MGKSLALASRALLATSLFLLTPACTTQDDASIVILHNQAPAPGCVTTPSASAAGLSRGRIDALSPTGYLFTPIVQNFTETSDTASTAQRIAFIEGANISLSFESGLFSDAELSALADRNLVSFSERFSIEINPDGGLTSMQFFILPQQLMPELQAKLSGSEITNVLATIQLFGRLGGGDINSQEFTYPIDVCNGCLINDLGACSMVDPSTTINLGGSCFPLQDTAVVDCCTEDGALLCPAVVPSMP